MVSTRFDEIATLFRSVEPEMRLELLMEFGERLPALPAAYHGLRDAGMHLIRECQSPVFLLVEVHADRVGIRADVPREAPTARGFVALLFEAFDGAHSREVLAAPEDVLAVLGLTGLVGMQRTRGLSGIYRHIRREVER